MRHAWKAALFILACSIAPTAAWSGDDTLENPPAVQQPAALNSQNTAQNTAMTTAAAVQSAASTPEKTEGVLYTGAGAICHAACLDTLGADLGAGSSVCASAAAKPDAEAQAQAQAVKSSDPVGTAPDSTTATASTPNAAQTSAPAQQKPASDSKVSCAQAAMLALTAGKYLYGALENSSNSATNTANAGALNSQNPNALAATAANGSGSGSQTSGGSASSDPCSGSMSSSSAVFQCAASHNPSIPAIMGTPGFAKLVQKTTGMSLGDMMSKDTGALANAVSQMVGDLPKDQAQTVATAFENMKSKVHSSGDPASAYSGGAGGGGGSRASGTDPMQMMTDFMKDFVPGGAPGKDDKSSGLSAVAFANRRSPASVTEDRTLSLFDRVTYRYHFVGKQMLTDTLEPAHTN